MDNREIVDELLERWEATAEVEPGLSPAEFLRRERRPLSGRVRDEFLRRAEALARADRRLGGLRPREAALTPLTPGFEPIPGYRLERPLGAGGFGQVWRASGPGGVPAALKFVPLGRAVSAAEWRAVRLMKDVRHPHLIAVSGAWEAHGHLVIAMEPADGSLTDRLQQCTGSGLPSIPRDEVVGYLSDAARALDYLNEPRHPLGDGRTGGIQHRDVKPQNLLLVGGGVKVADFGLARALTAGVTGHTGSMTAAYAAPEFFEGRTSAHSDQYSLAVTYCHLRGGRLPFVGSPAELMIGHMKKEPDLSMLPGCERSAVARALAKQPDKRWPSCTAFVAALREPTPPPSIGPRRRVHPKVLVGIVELIAAGAVVLWQWRGGPGSTGSIPSPTSGALPETGVSLAGAIRPSRRIEVGPLTTALAVSPDGRFVACVGPKEHGGAGVAVFDLRSGMVASRKFAGRDGIAGHSLPVRSVSYSPDGEHLVTADEVGRLVFWEASTGRLETAKFGWLANYAPDEPVVLVADRPTDLSLERLDGYTMGLGRVPGPVEGLALSPAKAYALSCSVKGEVSLWDRKTWKEDNRWTVPRGGLGRPAFTPDGRKVLLGSGMYAVPGGSRVVGLDPPPAEIVAASLSRDGRRAVAVTPERSSILWDTSTGKEVCRLGDCHGDIRSIAFAPDGAKVVAVATDGGLYVWEVPVG